MDVQARFSAADAARSHIQASDAGAMVFILSIAALHTPGGSKPYATMKAAVINFARGLAWAPAAGGVCVNCVSPGNICFEDGVWGKVERNNPEFFQKHVSANPRGRRGTPHEVANAAVSLARPVSSFFPGQT